MKEDPVVQAAPAEKEVRVYNKSQHQTFIHGPHRAAPASFASVPESVAKNWYRLFPDVVVEAGVAQKELGGVQSELLAEKEKVAKLQAELDALKNPKKAEAPKGKVEI